MTDIKSMKHFIIHKSQTMVYENRLSILKNLYNDNNTKNFLVEHQDGVRINLDRLKDCVIKKLYYIIKNQEQSL